MTANAPRSMLRSMPDVWLSLVTRAAMGVVPQDTVLFNDTIGYNINYGDFIFIGLKIREKYVFYLIILVLHPT